MYSTKSLETKLSTFSEQQLEQSVRLWNVTVPSKSNPQQHRRLLLQRMRDPIAARFVWEMLSPDERLVLFRTLGHQVRNGIRRDTLQKKTRLSPDAYDTALTALIERLLLTEEKTKMRGNQFATYFPSNTPSIEEVQVLYPFMESVDALYATGREIFSPVGSRLAMPLEKILKAFDYNALTKLMQYYDIDVYERSYFEDFRVVVAGEMVQAEVILPAITKLETDLQKLFRWLCNQGGKVTVQQVREQTGYDDVKLISTLHTLGSYALVFDTFSDQEQQEHMIFVPQQIFENIKKAALENQAAQPVPKFVPLDTSPPNIHISDTVILYDIAILVGAVYQQNIEPTQAGNVPKRIATKLLPLLHGQLRIRLYGEVNEYNYMEMLFDAASEAGIMQLSESFMDSAKPRYEPGSRVEQWSQSNAIDQVRQLLQVWLNSFHWLDLLGVNYTLANLYSFHPMEARKVILEHLQQCVPGRWYSVPAILQAIWDKDPWALRTPQYGRSIDTRKTNVVHARWNMSDGEVYIGILASTLYELGIVSLGYDQENMPADKRVNPHYFMLTDLGASAIILDAVPPPAEVPASNGNRALIVQPNFEILLLEPDMPALYSVLPFAQVNKVELVSRLTITRQSVLRGMESGKGIEAMIRTLEERSQKELPQNVAYTMRDWVKFYKDVKVSQVFLFEVTGEDIADEIVRAQKLQPFGIHKIGPCLLVASNDIDLQELKRALEKEGIVVHFSGKFVTPQRYHERYSGFTFGTLR